MIVELQRLRDMMQRSLDSAIKRDEEPLVQLWSDAIEMIEQARRLALKASVVPETYELVSTEAFQDMTAPSEENVAYQHRAEYKAARLNRNQWFRAIGRVGGDYIATPYGVVAILASDTCPEYYIEWLA